MNRPGGLPVDRPGTCAVTRPGNRLVSRVVGRALLPVVAIAACSLALAGCVELPSSGPVVTAGASQAASDPGPMYIDPLPPQPGDSPAQVVKGFLDAMLATPVQTNTARQFLTRDERDSWDPRQETITFAGASPPRGTGSVRVDLSEPRRIDARGAWQGAVDTSSLTFQVVEEDGDFRIADAPDALIVPEQWFEQRFRQVSLYFFDPTGTILVPEPVFVPDGEQLASTLVRGLLAGPPTTAIGSAQSFFPPGLTAGLSVPVSADGVADLALVGAQAPVDGDQADLLVAQLTTTLRQDPAVQAVRLSIDGQPLDLPGDVTEVGLNRGESFAPYVASASSLLYAVRGGVLVGGSASELAPVDGPFGTTVLGVRSIVPDLTATTAAAVSTDGTSLLIGPVRSEGQVQQVLSGATDLLPPAWEFSGRLWLVDRTAAGAQVLQRQGDVARVVDVPGVSGQDVRRMLVSRDGSRLLAVIRGGDGDAVVVSRILHDEDGRVVGATPTVRIDGDGDDALDVRDIAWRSPTTIAVLSEVNDSLFQVQSLPVDGAPSGPGALSTTIKGDLRELVGSPVPGQALYAAGPGVLNPLSGRGEGPITVDPAIDSISYAGG